MKERNIATAIILSLVTCGIYGLYWMVVLTDELKEQADDHNLASGGLALLFTIFETVEIETPARLAISLIVIQLPLSHPFIQSIINYLPTFVNQRHPFALAL